MKKDDYMPPKSKSLTFPTNPLEAMRELQELNDVPPASLSPQNEATSTKEDITANITSNITAQSETNKERNRISKVSSHKPAQQRSKKGSEDYVKELASSRMAVVTLRLPEGLNDWLDEYAHQHRKEGVKKQDLISEAIQLLVMAKEAEE